MRIYRKKSFWIILGLFSSGFILLMLFRTDVLKQTAGPGHSWLEWHLKKQASDSGTDRVAQTRHQCMNIFQNQKKIGYSHRIIDRLNNGYRISDKTVMRINTMGMVQDVAVDSTSSTDQDYALNDFSFALSSGKFHFTLRGNVKKNVLYLLTGNESPSDRKPIEIKLENKPYLSDGLIQAAIAADLKPDDELVLYFFDPSTMGQTPVIIRSVGDESVRISGRKMIARKLSLSFKGLTQYAWIDTHGEVIKEEGILGIVMIKSTREDALYGIPIDASQDFTELAAIKSNRIIDLPQQLSRLEVKISGIDPQTIDLTGGRQTLRNDILVIDKEKLTGLAENSQSLNTDALSQEDKSYLEPGPLIQSDHPKVRALVKQIVRPTDTPLDKVKKMTDWIQHNIQRRPVLSLPNAISTLDNKMGDCNEHAVLMAALCRAAGVPAKVEAGLVYMKGRFYYHAWNLVYLGKWVTVDTLFNQIPADVTHIRFVSGSHKLQLNMIGVIGKVKLEVIGFTT